MKPLLNGAMELPMDKYRIRIDELEKENERIQLEAKELLQKERQDKDALLEKVAALEKQLQNQNPS